MTPVASKRAGLPGSPFFQLSKGRTLTDKPSVILGGVVEKIVEFPGHPEMALSSGQNVGERFGKITHEEGTGLAKAVMSSGFLVSIVAAGAALHRELPWYWVLGYFVGAGAVFPLGSILFCIAWAWMMEKKYGQMA